MLRLSKFLSLELDVYRQIPPETLKKHPEDAPLGFMQCRLAIVGQELNGNLVLTHDAFYRGCRHIVLCHFDLHTRKLSHLYDERTDALYVVGATLDREKTILAYTTISRESRRDVSRTSDTGDVYESHIVELGKPRDERVSLPLHKKTTRRQMVQIIGKSPAKRNGVFLVYILVAIECASLSIFNIGMKRNSKTKAAAIHSLPSPDTVLVKEGLLLWFGYDVKFHSLTVLLKSSARTTSSPTPDGEKKMPSVQAMLRQYFFEGKGKRFNLAFEVALDVKRVSMSALINLRPTDPRKQLFPPGSCVDRRESTDHTSSFLADKGEEEDSIYSTVRPLSPRVGTPPLEISPSKSIPVIPRPRAGSPRSKLSFVSSDAKPYFRLVDIGKGVYCFCQQHPFVGGTTGMSPVICISIYMLHCGARLDIDVNLPNIRLPELGTTRVFFASIGALLLIYVPGAYLQYIDCISGRNMEPSPNLILGSELATEIPGRTAGTTISPALITPLHAESYTGARSDLRDHYFLNNNDGIVYEYTLDRNALLRVFDSTNPETHVQALHLAIIHMHDAELVHRVMENLCAHQPHVLTPELLHEYLLGVPYQAVKDKNMELHLLDLLPISSIETFASPRTSRHSVKYKPTPVVVHANRHLLQTKRSARFMVGHSKVHTRADFGIAGQGETSSSFGRLIRLFGWGDDTNPSEPSAPFHDSGGHKVDSEDRWQFVETLYDYMVLHFPKENKSKCMAWAKDFRREQIRACQVLFDYLKSIAASSSYARFQTMENFYCALEELQVPAPKDFNEAFTELSIWHLPRSVFLQYVERGVFRITEPIVHQLFGELSCSPEDNAFKFALLAQLPQKGFIRCLRRYPENYRYLVDYFLSVMPIHFAHPQDVKPELLHQTNSSAFIPMDILFANLAATQGIDTSPVPATRSGSVPVLSASAPEPTGSSPITRMRAHALRAHGHLHDSLGHLPVGGGSPVATAYPKGARTHAFVVEQISQSMKAALGMEPLEH